jgi:hypothetical protein
MLDEKGIVVNSYSLHLTEKSRTLYIHKNLKRIEIAGPVGLKDHYSCEVEDDIYDQVIENQIRHGLMIDGEAFPKNLRVERPSMATTITEYLDSRPKPEWHMPRMKNVTIQFSKIKMPVFREVTKILEEFDDEDAKENGEYI